MTRSFLRPARLPARRFVDVIAGADGMPALDRAEHVALVRRQFRHLDARLRLRHGA
jgi:hypothetical protein